MPARTNATRGDAAAPGTTATTAGILRPEEFARHVELQRLPPSADLALWVENHWVLRWSLPDDVRFVSQVLPHPTTNLTVERGVRRPEAPPVAVLVTGPVTRRFDVQTTGSGWVWGVRFRPGGFAALAGADASALAERTVAAADVLAPAVVARLDLLDRLDDAGTPAEEDRDRVEAALRPLAVGLPPDPEHELVLAVVADMLADPTLVRVAQVAERHGVPVRRLQRLFARYVGVGPKWVLARHRMHDVVSALDAGWEGSLADLAAEHGWYDQAHSTRDFRALVGVTPAQYREGR